MTEPHNKILYLTLLLTAVAGFCDTVTFVAADNIFSAHVTGNFIVFAYQLIKGSDTGAWIKLITFPVFILSVITGGWLARDESNRYTLLVTEGILLAAGGLAFYLLQAYAVLPHSLALYTTVMVVVFAMGMQNAFSRLFAKETHGPTTIMTGNVTQAALDLGSYLRRTPGKPEPITGSSLRKHAATIGGFLGGCLLGAFAGRHLGLASVAIPGVVILVSCRWIAKLS